ncbi:MAG: TRAP transporter small permease subunit [Proteobacteria bacterium]|nr:TRAP transporter small permease subunit [Pseudomonadota bacterium]MBU1585775.1 TRAP transporter small permease subunit [Pseudomonadota bacterium]MBU2452255.1 TRAP transporter small permease subunit [Pseudomonadota bacterium]MBU2632057.1 TRAP transporter small permease subunit [Pseudomonadota bacterium]
MQILENFVRIIDGLSDRIGHLVGWMTTLMVLVVFFDTVMRYAFHQGNVALQELEWHLFSIVFLIGAAYTLKEGGHVRVDIIFINLSQKTKAWIDFIGIFIFLLPLCAIVILSTKGFVLNSWAVREVSPDPGGLQARYILKAMIPLGFSLLIVQGFSEAAKNFMVIMGYNPKVTRKKQGDKS